MSPNRSLVNDATTDQDYIYWGSGDVIWRQDEVVIITLKRIPIPPTTETPAPEDELKTALVDATLTTDMYFGFLRL